MRSDRLEIIMSDEIKKLIEDAKFAHEQSKIHYGNLQKLINKAQTEHNIDLRMILIKEG
jgi:hypothetical protein